MNIDDIKLNLMLGSPIYIDEDIGYLKPLTIGDVSHLGYLRYLEMINFFSKNKEDLIGDTEIDLSIFDVMFFSNTELREVLCRTIETAFNTDTSMVIEDEALIIVGKIDKEEFDASGELSNPVIHNENFDDLSIIIKYQNGLMNESDIESKAKDSKAEEILKKIKKSREDAKKFKKDGKDENESIDLIDIISSVTAKSNSISKINIEELTIYQLYDEFRRLNMIDQYNVSIDSMMAGATNVDVKHWSEKMKN